MEKSFETEVLTRLAVIESKIDDYKNLQQKCDEAHSLSSSNKERIDKIEDTMKWLWRTIGGILISGAVAVIYKIGG